MKNIEPSKPRRNWAESRRSFLEGLRKLLRHFLRHGVRWGALLPFALFVAVVGAYFVLFFDLHLRLLMQRTLSLANGAKVDIASVRTSFFRCEFEMKGMDVGNPQYPMTNRFSVERVYFHFLFGPLLNKKLVVHEASIKGIAYDTLRTTSAALPASKQAPFSELTARVSEGMSTALKEKIGPNEISTLEGLFTKGDLLAGLGKVGEATQTAKKLKEVQAQLNKAQTTLPTQLADLPDEATVKALKSKVEGLTKSNPKTPEDFLHAIQGLNDVKKDVTSQTEKITVLTQSLNQEMTVLTEALASVDDSLRADIAGVQAKLKIPGVGLNDITPQLLGRKFQRYLEQATHLVDLSRKYMPTKKDKEGQVVEVKKDRARGTDFHFGRAASFPSVLLEKTLVSSNVSANASLGNVVGEIIGINSHPAIYGRPTTATVKGDFPAARVRGAELRATIDHVTDVHAESLSLTVDSFPLEEWRLSEGPSLELAIKKALGNFSFRAFYAEDELKAEFAVKLSGISYVANASQPKFAEIVNRALASMKSIEVWGKAEGPLNELRVSLASDMGARIAQAIQKEFKVQIAAVNAHIQREVSAQVDAQKKAVEGQFARLKTDVLGPAEARLKSLQEVSHGADSGKHKLEQDKDRLLKQHLDPLKKNIKIPGIN